MGIIIYWYFWNIIYWYFWNFNKHEHLIIIHNKSYYLLNMKFKKKEKIWMKTKAQVAKLRMSYFNSWFCNLLAMWPWACCLAALGFSVLIFKIEMLTSNGYYHIKRANKCKALSSMPVKMSIQWYLLFVAVNSLELS